MKLKQCQERKRELYMMNFLFGQVRIGSAKIVFHYQPVSMAVTVGNPIILESTAVVVLAANETEAMSRKKTGTSYSAKYGLDLQNCFPTSTCFNGSDSWQPYHTRIYCSRSSSISCK